MNSTAAQQMFQRLGQRTPNWWLGTGVPVILTLVMLVVIASQLASLTWLLLEPDETVMQTPDATPGVRLPSTQPAVNWGTLKLFGNESKPTASKPVKVAPRVTDQKSSQILKRLNVKLVGVVASSNPQNSWIAVNDGGRVELFRSGDEIRDGVVIEEIRAKDVTLRLGAVTEVIAMSEGAGSGSRASTSTRSTDKPARSGSGTFRISNEEAQARIEGYLKTLKSDPLSLIGKVRTIAVVRNGEIYGQRLRPGSDRTLLRDVGLRSGDILLSVNGIDLNSAANAGSVIESMSASQESLQLKIDRGGKVRDLRIELR